MNGPVTAHDITELAKRAGDNRQDYIASILYVLAAVVIGDDPMVIAELVRIVGVFNDEMLKHLQEQRIWRMTNFGNDINEPPGML